MLIEVTQEDIDNGLRAQCDRCPIALGLRRQTGYPTAIVASVYWRSSGGEKQIFLPIKAVKFIRQFDSGEKVSPCTFKIQMPNE